MKKLFIVLGLFLFIFSIFPTSKAFAKTQPAPAVKETKKITVSYSIRADKHALEINFGQLQNATSVHYEVIYKGDKVKQGAIGDLNLHGQSTQNAEVVFGTCSQASCVYYDKVKDLRLKVRGVLTNGKKFHQRYSIEVK